MSDNPLKRYFRQPSTYLRLPTLGRWYNKNDVQTNEEGELPVYGLSAIDDIMLNTPDAMLNGKALENVIKNCVPDVKDVKKLLTPDMEAIFVGIKMGTTGGKFDIDRKCPHCGHENTFEIICSHVLDTMSYVEDSDTVVAFDADLEVHIKPYSFEMRHMFIQRQFEEERALKLIDEQNKNMDELTKAKIIAESIEKMTRITFELVSRSIENIRLIKQNITVTDPAQLNEWLVNITKNQADKVIEAVNKLNEVGVNKKTQAVCQKCGKDWEETMSFDPISFFGKR